MAFEDWSFIISIKDIKNFIQFKKDMMKEQANYNSKFNRYKLKLNWMKNVVYYQINCTEDELQHFDYHPDAMIIYKMKSVVDYMTELGWSEYLIPQVNNFVDEEGNPSLSYGITLVFTPFKFRFYKPFLWVGILAAVAAGVCSIINLVNW